MHSAARTLGFVAALAASTASASPLSEYNLVLLSDYNFQGGEVEGRTLIGGNLNAGGSAADFASRVPRVSVVDSLEVVGDLNAANIQVQHGNVVYGGSNNVTGNINFNGTGALIHRPGLSIHDVSQALYADAATYSALAANGTFANGQLTYGGNEQVAVFNLSASEVFANNTTLKLDHGAAQAVVINVSGTNITAGGGVNLTDGFRHHNIGASNILWNFHEANTINFQNIAMFGSVLAPSADISGGAVFDGSVAANSYTGAREFHRFLFNPPTVSVSEPAPLALGLLILAIARLRRRS